MEKEGRKKARWKTRERGGGEIKIRGGRQTKPEERDRDREKHLPMYPIHHCPKAGMYDMINDSKKKPTLKLYSLPLVV